MEEKSKSLYIKRTQRDYPMSFKLAVVREVESGAITNNGKAIPAEVAENIFTPFFTTKTDGSGIGLAVSRQIVRLHGGSLRLKHNDEGRVTFAMVME